MVEAHHSGFCWDPGPGSVGGKGVATVDASEKTNEETRWTPR